MMSLNVDQLQKQLDKDKFQEDRSMLAFWVINKQFQKFIDLEFTLDYDSQTTNKYFVAYTGIKVKQFKETLLEHMGNVKKLVAERTRHQRQYERRVNKRQMRMQESKVDTGKALDADLVVTKSSRTESQSKMKAAVTQHYLPKRRESVFAKPYHMIASSESQNSSKNMLRFSSNDMVHNHYQDEARKKTQEKHRNSKTSMMPSARFQRTADDSKPKPKSTNHSTRSLLISKSSCITITDVPIADHSKNSNYFLDSKHFVCSTCHKCVFNANHDACITKLLKEVSSHAKIQSYNTINNNKPVDQKSHTQNPGRQIITGHRFSPNKTSAVYEKTSPRSDLRWKPIGRIFKSVGLRWNPTGKLFDSCTSKDDSEPTHGSNVDIPNIHECKQTLDLSAGTSLTGIIEMEPDIENMRLKGNHGEIIGPKVVQQSMKGRNLTLLTVTRVQFLTLNVPDEIDKVIQPLIPQPIHTIPPNDDYVAPATKLILDKLLDEFGDKILNVTMVNEEADFNLTKDIEELERLLAKDPQSHFTKIQQLRRNDLSYAVIIEATA
nr:actin-binding, cofilin/tropomyosin type [Tanacetum cinerariifolium]